MIIYQNNKFKSEFMYKSENIIDKDIKILIPDE